MKIEMVMIRDGIDGDVKAYDDNGKAVQVARIEVTPYFSQPSGVAPVMFMRTFRADGQLLQRGRLILPGQNGKTRVADITKQVKPYADGVPKVEDEPDAEEDDAAVKPQSREARK